MTIEDQLKEAARQGAALALQAAGVYMKQTDAAALAGKDRRTVGNWKRTGKVRAKGTRVSAGDVLGMAKS